MSSLDHRPPFAQLSGPEFRRLEELWAEISVAPGTVLAREGHACREFGIVANPVTIVACTAMTLEVMSLREFRSAYTTMPALRDHIDHQIDRRSVTWLLDASPSVPAPRTVPSPPPAHDGDYTLAS